MAPNESGGGSSGSKSGKRRRRRRRRGGGGGGGGNNSGGGGGGGGGNRSSSKNRSKGSRRGRRGRGGGGRRSGGGNTRRGRGGRRQGGGQQWHQKQPEWIAGTEVPETCDGVVELRPDGSGVLRQIDKNLIADASDIAVPKNLVRRFNIDQGTRLIGRVQQGDQPNQRPQVEFIESLDGKEPDDYKLRVPFKHLTSIDPDRWIRLEGDSSDVNTRVMDLLAPIGFGQRFLIVAPPRSGKTVILQKIGHALNTYYDDVKVMVLLINERPEEVTDIRRTIEGEVIASSLDDLAPSHVAVAEMAFARAQRLVEQGEDVVMLVDSLTRMARAYNMEIGSSKRTMSGGLDSRAMEHPKRHFGSARNVETGGSLTVIATALVDTGSRMDQVIFEEFKGTGNAELVLSRKLADQRIYPALDIGKSGTRKEEKLLPPDILSMTWTLRRVLTKMKPDEAMELLVAKLETTRNNFEFLEHFKID